MVLNNIVWDPEEIKSLEEVTKYLSKIKRFERRNKRDCGVLLVQRRQFDGLYIIVSKKEALAELSKPILNETPEFGIKYWSSSYFEALRKIFSGKDISLPEPLTRRNYQDTAYVK